MAPGSLTVYLSRGIPSVSLRRLFPEATFIGCADWEVTGCSDDHRRLEPGQVFVAIREAHAGYDGQAFVREALDRGAAGVVVEAPCPEAGRLQVVVPDAPAAYARICHALAGDPSRQLAILGVTGSFGRTITAPCSMRSWSVAGKRAGCISTLGFCDGITTRPLGAGFGPQPGATFSGTQARSRGKASGPGSSRSTPRSFGFAPGAASLSGLLADMVEHRCKAGVLEISSESLADNCFEGVAFHAAVVTDISVPAGLPTRDVDREATSQSRAYSARSCRAVWPSSTPTIRMRKPSAGSTSTPAASPSRWNRWQRPGSIRTSQPACVRLDGSGTRMVLHGFDREAAVHLPLFGPRVATCALAAATLAWALEIDRAAVVAGLESVRSVAGHLESVSEGQEFDVRIDLAQTPGRAGRGPGCRAGCRGWSRSLRLKRRGAWRADCAPMAGRNRRRRCRSHHPDRKQPPNRRPKPDPRRLAGRPSATRQGPRRSRPANRHRGRSSGCPHRRYRADHR